MAHHDQSERGKFAAAIGVEADISAALMSEALAVNDLSRHAANASRNLEVGHSLLRL